MISSLSSVTCLSLVLLLAERPSVDAFMAAPRSMTTETRYRSNVFASVEGTSSEEITIEVDDAEAEEKFKEEIRELCAQRNLPLEKVKNCRDLAAPATSPIKPGRLYRTGRLGDATEKDRELLFDKLGITTLVDLRSPTELKDDAALMAPVFDGFTDLVWMENGRRRDGCLRELEPGMSPLEKRKRFGKGGSEVVDAEEDMCEMGCDDPSALSAQQVLTKSGGRKERHFVSLMNEFKYVRGTVTKLRKRDIAKALFKAPGAFLSKRIWTSLKKPFITEINSGGLIMLNDLLLRFGAPGIKYVLDLCAESDHHPVAFYCTAGKDRTVSFRSVLILLIIHDNWMFFAHVHFCFRSGYDLRHYSKYLRCQTRRHCGRLLPFGKRLRRDERSPSNGWSLVTTSTRPKDLPWGTSRGHGRHSHLH